MVGSCEFAGAVAALRLELGAVFYLSLEKLWVLMGYIGDVSYVFLVVRFKSI